MQRVAHENATAQLMVRVITFSDGAQWHVHPPRRLRISNGPT